MRRIEITVGSTRKDINAIADEIESYLERHPNAADTDVGICEWWLKRQRIEENVKTIGEALSYLMERGRIERGEVGGQSVYRRSAKESE